jgi:hypothetical protein
MTGSLRAIGTKWIIGSALTRKQRGHTREEQVGDSAGYCGRMVLFRARKRDSAANDAASLAST